MHKDGFSSNFLQKAHFIVRMTGLTMVRPASLTKGKHPVSVSEKCYYLFIYLFWAQPH